MENNIVTASVPIETKTEKINTPPTLDIPISDSIRSENIFAPMQIPISAQTVTTIEKIIDKYEWPQLTIDDINTSLGVVGDLISVKKLKIVNDKHLAVETSYIPTLTRLRNNQGRDRIISFLEHLFVEVKRNINIIIIEIKRGVNVNDNICTLGGIIRKISIFLHNYANMQNMYNNDSDVHNRFQNNRDKFSSFLDNLFRDIILHQ